MLASAQAGQSSPSTVSGVSFQEVGAYPPHRPSEPPNLPFHPCPLPAAIPGTTSLPPRTFLSPEFHRTQCSWGIKVHCHPGPMTTHLQAHPGHTCTLSSPRAVNPGVHSDHSLTASWPPGTSCVSTLPLPPVPAPRALPSLLLVVQLPPLGTHLQESTICLAHSCTWVSPG